MLLQQRFLDGIAAGTISLAFRRWRRPTVRPGGQLRTAIGVLAIDAVDIVDAPDITEADARRAGYGSRAELLASLDEMRAQATRVARAPSRASAATATSAAGGAGRAAAVTRASDAPGDGRGEHDMQIYRVALRFAGADPRVALRGRDTLTDTERETLAKRLARLDGASRRGPWTETVLRLIAKRPAVRAAVLAESLGRDVPSFKADVRTLKELGLTESLEVGYRLSPRGRAWLEKTTA